MKRLPAPVALCGRALAVWALMVVVETLHGVARQLLIAPALGDLPARHLAVLTGSLLILLIAWLMTPWLRARTLVARLGVGLAWVVLMLAFELGLGHALGYSQARLLADYDFRQGGLMVFGMLVLLLAPLAGAWLREHCASAARCLRSGKRPPG